MGEGVSCHKIFRNGQVKFTNLVKIFDDKFSTILHKLCRYKKTKKKMVSAMLSVCPSICPWTLLFCVERAETAGQVPLAVISTDESSLGAVRR